MNKYSSTNIIGAQRGSTILELIIVLLMFCVTIFICGSLLVESPGVENASKESANEHTENIYRF
jgi:flagellar basal body-associated protein FliL